MKRMLLVLVLTTFVVGGVAAAGQEEAAAAEGPVPVTWVSNNEFSGVWPSEDGWMVQYINETYGLDLDVLEWDIFSQEAVTLKLAAGEIPDFMIMPGYFDQMVDQGLLREIPKEMLEEKTPNLVQLMAQIDPQNKARSLWSRNGRLYAIPGANTHVTASSVRLLRKDWLENLGLSEPTTLEELETVFEAFVKQDPDGNGEDDTYAIGLHPGNPWTRPLEDVFCAFGLIPGQWIERDGKLVRSEVTPEYRDALRMLSDWYERGFFDPEFVNQPRETTFAKFSEDLYGSYSQNWRWLSPTFDDSPTRLYLDKHPNASWEETFVLIDNVAGPDGHRGGTHSSMLNTWTYAFGKDATDEAVERVLDLVNDAYGSHFGDMDYTLKAWAGVEGTHFEYGEYGETISLLDGKEERVREGFGNFFMITYSQGIMDYRIGSRGPGYEVMTKGFDQPKILDALSPFQLEESRDYVSEVATIHEEFFYNVMTGTVDVDDAWDEYVTRMNRSGLDRMTEEANAIVDELE